MISSALGFLGAAAVGGTMLSKSAGAVPEASVSGPARVLAPAEHVGPRGELEFPVDPVGGDLIMPNGYREGQHKGIDLGNECSDGHGRPLLACASGVVNSMRSGIRPGKFVTIRDGSDNYYRYHHLESYLDGLEEGDEVQRGQVIGYMGSTGNTAWAHVHFEVWRLSLNPRVGHPVDPLPLLTIPRGVTIGSQDCSG